MRLEECRNRCLAPVTIGFDIKPVVEDAVVFRDTVGVDVLVRHRREADGGVSRNHFYQDFLDGFAEETPLARHRAFHLQGMKVD